MGETPNSPTTLMAVVAPLAGESRRSRRAKVGLALRARPSDPEKDDHFEEVRMTLNASRDGIYFATWSESYYHGMRLFVTFPYSSSVALADGEYVGQVMRVDRLGDGRLGVAVQLLTTINLRVSNTSASTQRK